MLVATFPYSRSSEGKAKLGAWVSMVGEVGVSFPDRSGRRMKCIRAISYTSPK